MLHLSTSEQWKREFLYCVSVVFWPNHVKCQAISLRPTWYVSFKITAYRWFYPPLKLHPYRVTKCGDDNTQNPGLKTDSDILTSIHVGQSADLIKIPLYVLTWTAVVKEWCLVQFMQWNVRTLHHTQTENDKNGWDNCIKQDKDGGQLPHYIISTWCLTEEKPLTVTELWNTTFYMTCVHPL